MVVASGLDILYDIMGRNQRFERTFWNKEMAAAVWIFNADTPNLIAQRTPL